MQHDRAHIFSAHGDLNRVSSVRKADCPYVPHISQPVLCAPVQFRFPVRRNVCVAQLIRSCHEIILRLTYSLFAAVYVYLVKHYQLGRIKIYLHIPRRYRMIPCHTVSVTGIHSPDSRQQKALAKVVVGLSVLRISDTYPVRKRCSPVCGQHHLTDIFYPAQIHGYHRSATSGNGVRDAAAGTSDQC